MNGLQILNALKSDPVCNRLSPIVICQDQSLSYITKESKHKLVVINSSNTTEKFGKHWLSLNLEGLDLVKNRYIQLYDSAGKNLKDTPILEKAIKLAKKKYKAKLLSLKTVQMSILSSCGAHTLACLWLSSRKLLPNDIIHLFYSEKNVKNLQNHYKNDCLVAFFVHTIFPNIRKNYSVFDLIFDWDFLNQQRKNEKKEKKEKKRKKNLS